MRAFCILQSLLKFPCAVALMYLLLDRTSCVRPCWVFLSLQSVCGYSWLYSFPRKSCSWENHPDGTHADLRHSGNNSCSSNSLSSSPWHKQSFKLSLQPTKVADMVYWVCSEIWTGERRHWHPTITWNKTFAKSLGLMAVEAFVSKMNLNSLTCFVNPLALDSSTPHSRVVRIRVCRTQWGRRFPETLWVLQRTNYWAMAQVCYTQPSIRQKEGQP